MKKATAITFFNDSVGKRMSMVYSEMQNYIDTIEG